MSVIGFPEVEEMESIRGGIIFESAGVVEPSGQDEMSTDPFLTVEATIGAVVFMTLDANVHPLIDEIFEIGPEGFGLPERLFPFDLMGQVDQHVDDAFLVGRP